MGILKHREGEQCDILWSWLWFKASWKDGPRQSWPVNQGTQQSPIALFFLSVSSVLPRLPSTFTSRTPGGLCWNSTTLYKMKANQLTSHKLLNHHQSVPVRFWMRSVQGCIVDINPNTVARSLLSLLRLMWRHTLEILLKMYWFYWLQHIPGLNVNNSSVHVLVKEIHVSSKLIKLIFLYSIILNTNVLVRFN